MQNFLKLRMRTADRRNNTPGGVDFDMREEGVEDKSLTLTIINYTFYITLNNNNTRNNYFNTFIILIFITLSTINSTFSTTLTRSPIRAQQKQLVLIFPLQQYL